MSSFDAYKECKEKQEAGAPFYLDDDSVMYVARLETPKSQDQIAEIRDAIYGAFPNPKEVNAYRIWARWLGEYGVTNWEGVRGEDGEIPFTRENCRQAFSDESLWYSLVKQLIEHSADYSRYIKDQAEEDLAELKKP